MKSASRFRVWLVLGRVSNLPTVWSNCLAGWWLGGGAHYWKLPGLLLGVSLLYVGGMLLNDAFDVDFDRQRRPERPIPSGLIPVERAWRWGLGLLAAGVLFLCAEGGWMAFAAAGLAGCILLFNFFHKFFAAAPLLLGACRFWVYVIAGMAGAGGLNGEVIYCGAALAVYATGLGCILRRENFQAALPRWPLGLLAAPIALAFVLNAGGFRWLAGTASLVLAVWLGYCGWMMLSRRVVNADLIGSHLLAGMVWVDWLAVAPVLPHGVAGFIVFLALFGLTLGGQRVVPAM